MTKTLGNSQRMFQVVVGNKTKTLACPSMTSPDKAREIALKWAGRNVNPGTIKVSRRFTIK